MIRTEIHVGTHAFLIQCTTNVGKVNYFRHIAVIYVTNNVLLYLYFMYQLLSMALYINEIFL